MAVERFPKELIAKVLHLVKHDKPTILNCALVCRSWHMFAISLFYETLLLSGDIDYLLRNMKSRGIWVKKLIAKNEDKTLTKYQYDDMLSYFPNLTEMDIQNSMWFSYFHLARLSGRDKAYATRLENIHVKTKFMSQKEYQRYYICAYSLRKSLKHLQLNYINFGTYIFDGQSGNLFSHLKSFKNITHLSVNNNAIQHGDRNLSIVSLMELFPNLIGFSMKTNFNEPQPIMPHNKKDATINLNRSYKKLKSFSLQCLTISESNVLYFANFFPTCMYRFKLHLTRTNMVQLFESINDDTMKCFATFIANNVNEVYLKVENDSAVDTEGGSFLSTLKFMITHYWLFIQSMTRKQSNYHISISTIEKRRSNVEFEIVKHWKSTRLSYKLMTKEVVPEIMDLFLPAHFYEEKRTKSILVDDAKHHFIDDEFYLKLLESILGVFEDHLELVMISSCRSELQQLVFGRLLMMKDQPFFQHFSERTLKIDQNLIPTSSVKTAVNLNYGLIIGKRLKREYLKKIFELLPNLVHLKLIRCELLDTTEANNQYLLDIPYIQLDYLLLDISKFITSHFIVKVKYINMNSTVIYESTKKTEKKKLVFHRISLGKADKLLETDKTNLNMVTIQCHSIQHIDIAIMNETVALSITQ